MEKIENDFARVLLNTKWLSLVSYIVNQEADNSVDKDSEVKGQEVWVTMEQIAQTEQGILTSAWAVVFQLGHEFSKRDVARVGEESGLVEANRLAGKRNS